MKIVPILVGALSAEYEAVYGRLLAKYVDDPTNFFSVSSDFCHWGSRYVLTMTYHKKILVTKCHMRLTIQSAVKIEYMT